MEEKRYYWIKLKTDFFSKKEIDFLLSQENGCEYVVLYQMLCLNTVNNNGRLEEKMGEMIVRYDINKIVRDCKYFDYDTVIVALELYKKLGLIYEEEDGILKIANIDDIVGYAKTDEHTRLLNVERQRRFRQKQKDKDNVTVTDNITLERNVEYRDKSIEYRDINNITTSSTIININKDEENIFTFIEENFGRLLSPIEYEIINNWEDNELTRYAIKQAVLNGKYNIKYISKILESYKQKNIKTVQQAQQDEEEYQKRKQNKNKTSQEKMDEVFERFMNGDD